MDALSSLLLGFQVAITPLNLAMAFAGVALGTAIGALPGIGPINAVALLLPLCFALKLPPETALILLAGIYYGSGYGGRIASILLNIPGDPGLVMTTLDGYPLAKAGRGAAVLAISGIGSFVGGTGAVILMTFLAVPLVRLALSFSPSDYVALMVLAFALLCTMGEGRPAKTWAALALGLLFAMIGIDGGSGVERFTFDSIELVGGIDLPLVGLFARLLLVPSYILHPGVLALSFAGVYAVSNSAFELFIATGFGIIGYVLRKVGVPLIPIMLSFVLARLLEDNFRRALSLSDGDFRILFSTPASIVLWLMAAAALILPLVFGRLRTSIKTIAPEA